MGLEAEREDARASPSQPRRGSLSPAGRSPDFRIIVGLDLLPKASASVDAVQGLPGHSDGFVPDSHRLPFSACWQATHAGFFSCVYAARPPPRFGVAPL